uniref:Sclerostin n=1 Tax=Gasterosteus aculeatus TaxID=69293 RepID=G3NHR7_GASAC
MQVSLVLVVLLQGCCAAARGWKLLKNDATEILPEYAGNTGTPHEAVLQASDMNNRAKAGGRAANTVYSSGCAAELSCRELRSTRYITDGSCRSAKPVKELLCSGQCMPAHLLPNSIARGKWWRGSASDYRCVPAHSRTRRLQLHCPSGNTRTYKIRVVTSCKCKRFRPHHNQSEAKEVPRAQRGKKRDRSKNTTPTLTGNSY